MRRALLASLIALCAAPWTAPAAWAQPIQGFYVGAGGGANFLVGQGIRTTTTGNVTRSFYGNAQYDVGWVGLGSIGYALGHGLRVEVEGNYRYNGAGDPPAPFTRQSGHEQKYGVMGNALFDIDIGSPYVFPYIGGGVGYSWIRQNFDQTAPGVATALGDTKGGIAYQAIGGLSFPIPGLVGLSATAEYRYMAITGNHSFAGTLTSGGVTQPYTRKISGDANHAMMLGVRYAFNVPPPPVEEAPVVAPAPAPVRSYLVFFDWDRAELSSRARQIIAEAAANSTKVQTTRIEVNGYADTSGTPKYNMGLSIRRAQAVTAELVRLGVPRQEIATKGFGDTVLLVPTGPGVREPQNRRVEIVLK